MTAPQKRPLNPPEISAAAVRLLAERGTDVPSAHEIAAAAGMSRSAFFRRFASTGDAVFADHDTLLEELEELLSSTPLAPSAAIIVGARRILDHHLAQSETTRLRADIMRESPALRDRELVVSHRYERVYAKYLVEHADLEIWEVVALSASIVAIHNATLRRWLRDPATPAGADLERDLSRLASRFLSRGIGRVDPASAGKVLVAVYDAGDAEAVLAQVAATLRSS